MRQILAISVKEKLSELRLLQKQYPGKHKAIQMLILLRQKGLLSKEDLATMTGASTQSIHVWRTKYRNGGVEALLQENRGGHKKAAITNKVHQTLSKRLNNPKEGFRSFIEIQQWLEKEFGIEMEYHAVNKYVKRKFGARLKVSRKSHVRKSPAAEAVFKKPVRKTKGTSSKI
jgi:transposase